VGTISHLNLQVTGRNFTGLALPNAGGIAIHGMTIRF